MTVEVPTHSVCCSDSSKGLTVGNGGWGAAEVSYSGYPVLGNTLLGNHLV